MLNKKAIPSSFCSKYDAFFFFKPTNKFKGLQFYNNSYIYKYIHLLKPLI